MLFWVLDTILARKISIFFNDIRYHFDTTNNTVTQWLNFWMFSCTFRMLSWHGAQITKLFWIQNVLSSMHTWNKNKVPCDLFLKWLYIYTSKKLKIAKKLHWKRCLAYSQGNIYWCLKGHMRKSDTFRKPLSVIANLF